MFNPSASQKWVRQIGRGERPPDSGCPSGKEGGCSVRRSARPMGVCRLFPGGTSDCICLPSPSLSDGAGCLSWKPPLTRVTRQNQMLSGEWSRSAVCSNYALGLDFHPLPPHLHVVSPLSRLFLTLFLLTNFAPGCESHFPASSHVD